MEGLTKISSRVMLSSLRSNCNCLWSCNYSMQVSKQLAVYSIEECTYISVVLARVQILDIFRSLCIEKGLCTVCFYQWGPCYSVDLRYFWITQYRKEALHSVVLHNVQFFWDTLAHCARTYCNRFQMIRAITKCSVHPLYDSRIVF